MTCNYGVVVLMVVVVLSVAVYIMMSDHATCEPHTPLTDPSTPVNEGDTVAIVDRHVPQLHPVDDTDNTTGIRPSSKQREHYALPTDAEWPLEGVLVEYDVLSPCAEEILTYTQKDTYVTTRLDTMSMNTLAYQRYDLRTEASAELVLTDLYSMFELRNNVFYATHWPKPQSLAFIGAVVDEIRAHYPKNASAALLESCIAMEQGNPQEAIQGYKKVCESIQKDANTAVIVDMVKVARHLLASETLNIQDRNTIKQLTYDAGLRRTAPLALYMEGERVDVMLNGYISDKISPFDLSKSREFFKGKVPDAVVNGLVRLNLSSLSKKEQYEYCGYKLRALSMEQDPRALLELSNSFAAARVAPAFVKAARISAHISAGRMSQAVKEMNEVIDNSDDYTDFPNLVSSSYFQLGVILYEQGLYAESREVFNKCKEGLTRERVEQITTILRDPRMND